MTSERMTISGRVDGVSGKDPSVVVYKGIPYAAPPVGELRWKAPQPPVSWEGTRFCDHFGPTSIQGDRDDAPSMNPFAAFFQKEFYPEKMPMSEDCLFLNIWTPKETGDERLPVLLWIHGGGFGGGYGHEMEFDGEGFARRGVILVTINYRTGIMGFLGHPELSAESPDGVSGNYGILDQIAALRWVRQNIAAFGGDPDRITIAGQSAGAMSVLIHSATPLTKGLFSGAIMMSGGGLRAIDNEMSLQSVEAIGEEVLEHLGAGSIAELRKRPADEVHFGVAGFRPVRTKAEWLFFVPNADGMLLPDQASEIVSRGDHHDIRYMIGYMHDEVKSFTNMRKGIRDFAEKQIELGRAPAFVYCFDRALPGDDAGSFHSGELWYLFETQSRAWRPFTDGDRKLSDFMANCWVNFVRDGDPNADGRSGWTAYSRDSRQMMRLALDSGMTPYDEPVVQD